MSEIRLIDANALKEDLRHYFTEGVLDGISAKLAFNQILHDIDNAPTVTNGTYEQGFRVGAYGRLDEIRPQGKWETISESSWKCSGCGALACCKGNYCTDCGAEME